jgi:hypothetical protein
MQISSVPRPPAGVGTQAEPPPQRTASSNSGIGGFIDNLFGRR